MHDEIDKHLHTNKSFIQQPYTQVQDRINVKEVAPEAQSSYSADSTT